AIVIVNHLRAQPAGGLARRLAVHLQADVADGGAKLHRAETPGRIPDGDGADVEIRLDVALRHRDVEVADVHVCRAAAADAFDPHRTDVEFGGERNSRRHADLPPRLEVVVTQHGPAVIQLHGELSVVDLARHFRALHALGDLGAGMFGVQDHLDLDGIHVGGD